MSAGFASAAQAGGPGPGGEREAELRRRLAEAEDTLRAIREGEVDALVMRGPQADEVFALGGGDSYRAFMEAMDIGAAAIDADGRTIYANSALAGLIGTSAADIQARGLFAALGEPAGAIVRALVADAHDNRRSRQLALPCGRGVCHVEVTAAPLPLGFGVGSAVTFTDVTERIEAAAAHESDRIGRAIMASSNEAVVVCSARGIITHANAAVRHFRAGPVTGMTFEEAFDLAFPLDSGLMSGGDLVGVALSGATVRGAEATLTLAPSGEGTRPRGGATLDLVLSAGPLRQAAEAVGGCVITMADISERKASEKRQALLMAELTHRVKNTLTLVMSIANRTVATSADLSSFRQAFGRRLEALAATQSLLAEGAWRELTLADLVSAELAPFVTLGSNRVTLSGLDVRIGTNTAVAMGLIFHELVTNAVKYGALSNEAGRIAIAAATQGDALAITWTEQGGPPVARPARSGFGQTVIARGLGHGGEHATTVDFDPAGLRCRMFLLPDQYTPAKGG